MKLRIGEDATITHKSRSLATISVGGPCAKSLSSTRLEWKDENSKVFIICSISKIVF
jgi:hypothetical protein